VVAAEQAWDYREMVHNSRSMLRSLVCENPDLTDILLD
jgi:hypothetical protein